MTAFMILDPDHATQLLLVYAADGTGPVPNTTGEINRDGGALVDSAGAADLFSICTDRYGALAGAGEPVCIEFDHAPEFNETYRVTASGDGYPSIAATVTVPGDFVVREVDALGDPPGVQELRLRWTSSLGAYRYVVGVRPSTAQRCAAVNDCRLGWHVVTADTVLHTSVPAAEFETGNGPWSVDVYAMDRAAYEYLTTGSSGNLFPVPPIQNVTGGYGAVGAWVRRSAPLSQ